MTEGPHEHTVHQILPHSSIGCHRQTWFSPRLASDKQRDGHTKLQRYTHCDLEAATWILGLKVFQTFKFSINLVVVGFFWPNNFQYLAMSGY